MKANEAPEKLYIDFRDKAESTWRCAYTEKVLANDIEYTRTDAFIEKACAWLSNMSLEDMEYKYDDFDTSEGWYKMIEDFRNYMEGE